MQRIIIRRRPRVLRPLSPFKKGSNPAATIIDAEGEMDGCRQGKSQKSERTDLRLKIKLSFAAAMIKSSPLPSTLTCPSLGNRPHHCYDCPVQTQKPFSQSLEDFTTKFALWHLWSLEYSYSVGSIIGKILREDTPAHLASCRDTRIL